MPLRFSPKPRSIVLCDFGAGGFRPPEMVKRRPVIVIVGDLPHRRGLATIIPLSTTAPIAEVPYVVELTLNAALPLPFNAPICWAKCDMMTSVGFERLDFLRLDRDAEGKRQFLTGLRLSEADFDRVRSGVLSMMGLSDFAAQLKNRALKS